MASILMVAAFTYSFMPQLATAAGEPELVGGTAVTGYSGTATPITDLQISGTGNPTVPVKLRVTNGSLAMTTTAGLTFTGGSTGATLQFSGTLSDVNTALATLRYTRTGTGTDTLEASLVAAGEVFFPDNGHIYEYVSYTASWNNANTNAATRSKYGSTGYLTTITSQAENDFVAARLLNAGWMGASDAAVENTWRWVTGPESGIQFWSGTSSGSTVGGMYANWGTGEPNNAGDEDCAQFLTGGTGKWNDLPCASTTLPGYVVEYGGSTGLNISSKNVSITTQAANQYPTSPTSLSASSYWYSESTPILNFSLADPDNSDTVRYRIQVDNNSDFSSPAIDYTSALGAQGSKAFTVGQPAGSGSYTVGSSGQTLSDSNYYWRVKGIDNKAAESSYVAAASGGVGFAVDSTAPAKPATPTTTTPTSSTTPTWILGSVSDTGSGSGQRTIEWSTSPSFSGTSSATQSFPGATSYTHSTPLSEGVWYVRTRAADAAGNISAYSDAGSVLVDTTAPSIPGVPTVTTNPNDNTPHWYWPGSADTGSGLSNTQAYRIEYSQDPSFNVYTVYAALTSHEFEHTSSLADGTWYARIVAKDAAGNTSAASQIGSVAIDTVAPTAPGKPVVGSPASVNRPMVSWVMATDSGLGLGVPAYRLQWSKSPVFSGTVYSTTTTAASHTLTTALADGAWYFRVQSIDAAGNLSAYTVATTVIINTYVPSVVTTTKTVAKQTAVATQAEPATISEPQAAPAVIVLNRYSEYTNGSGKDLSLRVGQVIYFTVGSEQHSATIKEIGSDYVIVTIASTPTDVRVPLGQNLAYDVDKDGKDDIDIKLAAAQTETADMVFTELKDKPVAAKAPAKSTVSWWWIVVAILALLITWTAIRSRRTQSNLS